MVCRGLENLLQYHRADFLRRYRNYIVILPQAQKNQVQMLRYGRELVAELVDHADFPERNAALCDSSISAINEAL